MVADTERQLAIMVDVAKAKCDRGALMMLTTYRNDYELDELPPEDPVTRYNAAWHRNLCTRVMEQVPGVRLRYAFRPRSNRGEDK
jgi:hypothetical protein